MGVSKNRGTPKSWILIGFSIINHAFGGTPIFWNTNMLVEKCHADQVSVNFIEKKPTTRVVDILEAVCLSFVGVVFQPTLQKKA